MIDIDVLLIGSGVAVIATVGISISELVCHYRGGSDCFRRMQRLKKLLAGTLIPAFLAFLLLGLLNMALTMHGPQPTTSGLLTLLATTLIPVISLAAWIRGGTAANAILILIMSGLLMSLIYIRYGMMS